MSVKTFEAEAMTRIIRAAIIELMDWGGTTPQDTCEVVAEEHPEHHAALGADRVLALCKEIHESSDPAVSTRLQELFGVFNAKYFSGQLDFAVVAVYDAGRSSGEPLSGWVDFLNRKLYVALTQFGDTYPRGEHMQSGEEPRVDDAIQEVAALLAAAYRRRAKIRLVSVTTEALPSTVGLANAGEKSVHELKLTGQREESPR